MYTATVDYHTSGQYVGTVNAFTFGAISTKSRDFFYSYIDAISSAVMQPNSPMHWLGAGSGWSIGAGYQIMGYAGSSSTAQFTFTNGSSSEAGNYIAIALQPVSLKILSTTIPTVSLTNSYYFALAAVGGVGPYTWSTTAGTLFGLSLTAVQARLPAHQRPGNSSVTFQITDGTSTVTQAINFVVNASQATPAFVDGSGTAGGEFTTLAAVTAGDVIVVTDWISHHANNKIINAPVDSLGTHYYFIDACQNPAYIGYHTICSTNRIFCWTGSVRRSISHCNAGPRRCGHAS